MSEFYSYAYSDPRRPGNYEYDECRFPFEPFYVRKRYSKQTIEKIRQDSFNIWAKRKAQMEADKQYG